MKKTFKKLASRIQGINSMNDQLSVYEMNKVRGGEQIPEIVIPK